MKKALLLLIFVLGSISLLTAQKKFYLDIVNPITITFSTHNPPQIGDLATLTIHLTNDGAFPIVSGQYKPDTFPGGKYYFKYNAGIGSVNENKIDFIDAITLPVIPFQQTGSASDTFRLTKDFFTKGHSNIIIIWPGAGKAVQGKDSLDTIPFKTCTFYISDTTAGIIPQITQSSFNIYPNPAKDVVNIQMKEAGEGIIRLMDMTGKLIISKPYSAKAGENINLPLNEGGIIPDGLYLISIETGNSSNVSKIMICR